MRTGAAHTRVGKLVLATAAVGLVACLLYQVSRPPTTVGSLIQSVKQDASYVKLECAIESDNQKERLAAVQALLYLQTDEAFKLLEKATTDRSTVVRVAIVQRLRNLPQQKALPLIQKLLDDKEFGVVRDAVAALGTHTGNNYIFRFEAPPEEKSAVVERCKRDITERLK